MRWRFKWPTKLHQSARARLLHGNKLFALQ
jgi:hypothetical protein